MKNPFPGMNPYLEGILYHDLHLNLISKIQRTLIPLIQPKYIVRAERYVIKDDNPQSDMGIVYPDVEVFLRRTSNEVKEPIPAFEYGKNKITDSANLTIPVVKPIPIKIPILKITDLEKNELVTAIEVLSPVNKRRPGLMPYLQKRFKLHEAGVNFLEIDLLRRGKRTVEHDDLEKVDYLIALTRARQNYHDLWTIDMKSPLPVVPVPLQKEDGDVPFDLQLALNEVFEEMAYGLEIDYTKKPPPPKLKPKDLDWIKSVTSTT